MPSPGEEVRHHSATSEEKRYAPWLDISPELPPVTGIEHPCIIRIIEKGIQTLGGASRLTKLAGKDEDLVAKLYLKPDDRNCKPILAAHVNTSSFVLKILVPKRTGRKRKRGSDDSFADDGSDAESRKDSRSSSIAIQETLNESGRLLQNMRDNEANCETSIAGRVEATHRFRSLPDFVFSTKNNSFMQNMRRTILPFEYPKLKEFQFDKSTGVKHQTDLIAPPRWETGGLPFNYNYRQNPNVKEIIDATGDPKLLIQGLPIKQLNQHIPCDTDSVPAAPSSTLPEESTLDPPLQRVIAEARSLFESRPIWTRRALYNTLSQADLKDVGWAGTKHIQQYVGYCFDSGPWRDAIVRFGVDPRTDPECRIYQTLALQLERSNIRGHGGGNAVMMKRDWRTVAELHSRKSHLFDGKQVHTDGKTWQVCDISDPFLRRVLARATLREKCHVKYDGWYQNGAFAKVRTIMKFKVRKILEGSPVDDADLEYFEKLPDILRPETRAQWGYDKNAVGKGIATEDFIRMINDMRTTATRTQDVGMDSAVPFEDDEDAETEEPEDSEADMEDVI